jgi:small subunit ribosomal protein S7
MRGKRAKQKLQLGDKKYNNQVILRLINKVMQDGKKALAEDLVYTALESASQQAKEKDVVMFVSKVVDNLRPALEIKARRVGGANYQVPVPVSPARQETLVIRWIVDVSRGKSGKSFEDRLATELLSAYNGEGDAIKKKQDVERMAEANKAFAHFRW